MGIPGQGPDPRGISAMNPKDRKKEAAKLATGQDNLRKELDAQKERNKRVMSQIKEDKGQFFIKLDDVQVGLGIYAFVIFGSFSLDLSPNIISDRQILHSISRKNEC